MEMRACGRMVATKAQLLLNRTQMPALTIGDVVKPTRVAVPRFSITHTGGFFTCRQATRFYSGNCLFDQSGE